MTWYQTQDGRDGCDQIQIVEVNRCLAVDARVGCLERDLSGLRVDQLPVLAVGLVGQCVADLLQVEAAQVRHLARIDPYSSPSLKKQTRSAA